MASWVDLVREINFANQVLSVPVVVTRPTPDDDPIETRGIWLTMQTREAPGGPVARVERFRVMSLRRDQVPTVPTGTVILAAELPGGDVVGWRVDGAHSHETDHHRVIVLRAPDLDP